MGIAPCAKPSNGFFADLKHKHGLRWTTLWGKKKLSMQAMLVFAEMNGHGKALTAVLFIENTK
ncbi:hypothetical protein CHCC20348_3129 [Bacillus paralicheniformis]|nr:hypothetical protein CHCC20348_3129 [Bacillus paralicheniformis]